MQALCSVGLVLGCPAMHGRCPALAYLQSASSLACTPSALCKQADREAQLQTHNLNKHPSRTPPHLTCMLSQSFLLRCRLAPAGEQEEKRSRQSG